MAENKEIKKHHLKYVVLKDFTLIKVIRGAKDRVNDSKLAQSLINRNT
jgi:hypothetical protein